MNMLTVFTRKFRHPVAFHRRLTLKETLMTTKRKQRKTGTGRFAKGTSGNPAGRPSGSRNQATLAMETLLEGESEQLTRKAMELALGGDINALRLCLDRLLPPRKDRPIHLSLHPIKDVQQVSSAMSTVVEAIGDGRITPSEGEILANILDVQNNVLTTGEVERRVERLEQLEQARAIDKNERIDQEAADLVQRLHEGRSTSAADHDQP